MKTYNVTIKATITKTYTVEAADEDDAIQVVNELFGILNEDDVPEHYNEEVLDVTEMK